MKNILSLLSSRKFWLTAVGVFSVIAGKYYGMTEGAINDIVQLVSILVAAIAGVDIATKVNSKP